MKRRIYLSAASVVIIAAGAVAIGVLSGSGSDNPSGQQPQGTVAAVAEAAADNDRALSCEEVTRLDAVAASRGPVPGPERYPSVHPGFEDDAPRQPAPPAPDDGYKGVPKDQLEDPRTPLPESPPAESHVETELSEFSGRPCGEPVERFQDDAAKYPESLTLCYLADGRYAGLLQVDRPADTKFGLAEKDELCRHYGWAKSTQ